MKIYEFANRKACLDLSDGSLRDRSGKPVNMRPQSREVLQVLARHPGRIVTKEDFTEQVWEGRIVSEDALVQCIAEIRGAMGDSARATIQTIPRKGYRLNLPATARRGRMFMRRLLVPLAVLVIAVSAVIGYLLVRGSEGNARSRVVAVLPFDDLSPAPHRDYLSDAISEGIITNLARYPEMTVIARNSSFKFRDKPADIREIGEALGAGYVLEGSQQFDGSNLRVTAQLIKVADGAHVWADEWNEPIDDLFELNAIIGNRAANAVGIRITELSAANSHDGDVDALLLDLQSRELMQRQVSRKNWQEAMDLNSIAIDRFPASPWGYISTALNLRTAVRFGWTDEPSDQVLARATELAETAIEIAPDNYMGLYALGRIHMQNGDMERAIKLMERAIALNPSSSLVLAGLVQPFLYIGDTDKAARLIERIEADRPFARNDRVLAQGLDTLANWRMREGPRRHAFDA